MSKSFAALLEDVSASVLATAAQRWSCTLSSGRYRAQLDALTIAFRDATKARSLYDSLRDWVKTALAVVQRAGGVVDRERLIIQMRVLNYEFDDSHLRTLTGEAFLLRDTSNPDADDLVGNPALLALAGTIHFTAVCAPRATAPAHTAVRNPVAVILDIYQTLEAVDALGGLRLKASVNDVRAGEGARLARRIKWPDHRTMTYGRAAGHTEKWADALYLADYLDDYPPVRRRGKRVATLLEQPYEVQLRHLTDSWTAIQHWYAGHGFADVLGIATAFTVHPSDRPIDAWYPLAEFEREIARRLGHNDHQAIHAELVYGFYALGLIELGMDDGVPTAVRLSPIGHTVLRKTASPRAPRDDRTAAWHVQPNFDVLVYLDHVQPDELALLERAAERVAVDHQTAQYRLTNASVYAGLEQGLTIDTLLRVLERGAAMPLAQSITVRLKEWAERREVMTVVRDAQLLAFTNAEQRDEALRRGIQGQPIGDRWLSVTTVPRTLDLEIGQRVNYAAPPTRCLQVSEDGLIRVTRPSPSLFLGPILTAWASPVDHTSWQLTAGSVRMAVRQRKLALSDFFTEVDGQLEEPMPGLLRVALRAWAGRPAELTGGPVVVIRCEPELAATLLQSARVRPLLAGQLAPGMLLVERDHLAALNAALAWAGLSTIAGMSERRGSEDTHTQDPHELAEADGMGGE